MKPKQGEILKTCSECKHIKCACPKTFGRDMTQPNEKEWEKQITVWFESYELMCIHTQAENEYSGKKPTKCCYTCLHSLKEQIADIISHQRESIREEIRKMIETKSEIRLAEAVGEAENNFDFGYDVKTKELLSLLNKGQKENK